MFTETYGTVHDVLLNAASTEDVTPQSLRLLLAITEHGGEIEGASDKLGREFGANSTAIRRSSLDLRAAGLITSTSKRGVGLRLKLTDPGHDLGRAMLREIREALGVSPALRVAA